MQKIFILILSFFLFSSSLFAQKSNMLETTEISIHNLFKELFLSDGTKFIQTDSVKLSLSEEISKQFEEILILKESIKYPFDSLLRIGIRTSQDKKVRSYTWSIKLEDGTHKYYGFIQHKDGKNLKVFKLLDDSENIRKEENIALMALDHKHWYGMNFYKIIDFKYRGKTSYALLGARNNKYVSKEKVIEILSFSGKRAKFGKRVFKFNKEDDPLKTKRKQQRIIMEYNHNVSMIMTYDERYKMIVFDHLTPESSKLKGIRRFYGPDGSYDAFNFDGNKWVYIPDKWAVNERNTKQEELKTERKNKDIYKTNKKAKQNSK